MANTSNILKLGGAAILGAISYVAYQWNTQVVADCEKHQQIEEKSDTIDHDINDMENAIDAAMIMIGYENDQYDIGQQNKNEIVDDCRWTANAKNINDFIVKIKVQIKGAFNKTMNENCSVFVSYADSERIENIANEINKYLNQKYDPTNFKFKVWFICDTSFTKKYMFIDDNRNEMITKYDKYDIIKYGLKVKVIQCYEHTIVSTEVNCKYMKEINSCDPLHCKIYYGMKQNYEWNEENLNHLYEFTHFKNEYNEKPECKFQTECYAYTRLENGGNKLEDRCHLKLYRHITKTKHIQLSSNINSFAFNTSEQENHDHYHPTNEDKKKYGWNRCDGWLNALIQEVITNGYLSDLCLECQTNDECKHIDRSLLEIVENKMNHIKHIIIGSPLNTDQMLALVLYTGCDCNYDLCKSQRNGDYKKWKWFDYCLYSAIFTLSFHETGAFSVFSGLNGVKLDKKTVSSGYFPSYLSTSWNKQIALSFINGSGMLIQIDKRFKDNPLIYCCDVSWISKFPDECEILFARSLNWKKHKFQCIVLDDSKGIQTVSLKK